MRPSELRSQVVRDVDPYLEARIELERQQTIRRREWGGLPFEDRGADEVTWEQIDPHLQAARQQLQRPSLLFTEEQRAYWREQEEAVRAEYLKERDHARLTVRLADKAGEEVPAEIRTLAEGPDMHKVFADEGEKMRESRRRTLHRVLAG